MKRLIQFFLIVMAFLLLLAACAPSHPPTPTPGLPGPTASPAIGAQAIAWLKSKAIPLKTTTPGGGYDDLQPLGKIIGDARIVALGHATHGTHEFQEMNARLLEFLVEEMGFNTWAM